MAAAAATATVTAGPVVTTPWAQSDRKLPSTYQVVTLAKKANGVPTPDHFAMKTLPMPDPQRDLKPGQALVRVLYLSVDPYMRGRIGSDDKKSSSKPLNVGDVIVGATIGEIVHYKGTDNPNAGDTPWSAGRLVHCYSGWREYYVADVSSLELINIQYTHQLAKFVGVLGMTGLTSYYGMHMVGKIKKTDTVVVSGAAGAVGSIAGQIAKIHGCRVVGLAGTPDKCAYLAGASSPLTNKFDVVLNYKTEIAAGTLRESLQKACPNGVDVYFDNTGGEISDTVIPLIRQFARIVICGQISTYNNSDSGSGSGGGGATDSKAAAANDKPKEGFGPRLLHHLLWNSASMTGFLVQDFETHDQTTYHTLGQWVRDGQLYSEEDIMPTADGKTNKDAAAADLSVAPIAFCKLFTGANKGKQVVRVSRAAVAIEERIRADNNEKRAKEQQK